MYTCIVFSVTVTFFCRVFKWTTSVLNSLKFIIWFFAVTELWPLTFWIIKKKKRFQIINKIPNILKFSHNIKMHKILNIFDNFNFRLSYFAGQCHVWRRNYLPFQSIRVHPRFFIGVCVARSSFLCSIFGFLCSVLVIIVCPLSFGHCVVCHSASDYSFGIFKLFLLIDE